VADHDQKALRARIGAHALHAQNDSVRITEHARRGFLATFERKVDPAGVLSPEERTKRAQTRSQGTHASPCAQVR
jgi:hypothetical protein